MQHVALQSAVLLLGLSSVASGQVVELPDGKVEFLGLREWTVDRIQTELEAREPGSSLHHCAAVLKTLGFAEASVMVYSEEAGRYTVVSLVEPGDAQRVRYRDEIPGGGVRHEPWAHGFELRKDHPREFAVALTRYTALGTKDEAATLTKMASMGVDMEAVEAVWQFLSERAAEEDFERALTSLSSDPHAPNRAMAVAVLLNFTDRDRALWSLVDAARDPAMEVQGACLSAFWGLGRFVHREVDWAPAVSTLRHQLGGTNLFTLGHVLRILANTQVSPSLAAPLLADNGHLALAYAGAAHETEREVGQAFLRVISGADHGDSMERWRTWVAGLATEAGNG